MGCHTWFYTKDTITLEQALELTRSYILQLKRSKGRDSKGREVKKSKEALAPDLSMLAPSWSLSKLDDWSGYFQHFLYDCRDDLRRGKLCVITEKGVFLNTDEYHDLFRISTYPEDKLHSLLETLEFIEKHAIEEVDWNRLGDFWSKYPDGLIDFG